MGSFSFLSKSDREKIDGTETRADENTRIAEQQIAGGLADFPAKLTDYDATSGYYSWTRRKWASDRSREDYGVAIQVGTPTSNPARYPNGDVVDVSAGVDVWLRPIGVNPDVGMVHEVLAASGSGSCRLAALTAKDFSGPFPAYSWAEVSDTYAPIDPDDPSSPLAIIYTKTGTTGSPGSTPAYHEQGDLDLVVSPDSTHLPDPGVDCNCVGHVTAKVDNGDGTFTWTFGTLKCCRTGTVDAGTGACTACADVTPCSTDPVTRTGTVGAYPDVGQWAELDTLCRQPAQEAPPEVVYRICNGSGDWKFIPGPPRWEPVAISGNPDADGLFPGVMLIWIQGTTTVAALDDDIEIYNFNSFVGP